MKESYAENEEVFADIVIRGRIFDCSGRARNGALAVKDGRYLAIGECDDIVESYSELDQSQSKVLMKIEDGKIVYRKRHPNR